MKIYRGPKGKPFTDESHQFVSSVKPKDLEAGIRAKASIEFNVTKDGWQREAVCTAFFEEADVIPMATGLIARLTVQQECLAKIKKLMADTATTDTQKVSAIQTALSKL
jgi:hypothetical protein